MKVKSLRESALPRADVNRQPVPRVAVVRRIDPKAANPRLVAAAAAEL